MRRFLSLIALTVAWYGTASAAPTRTVKQLASTSEAIVHGRVLRQWSAWDASHETIWTHYVIEPVEVLRGGARSTYTISEPGGVVGDVGMDVSESVPFAAGEEVLVFLKRVPNGMLRVTGSAAGKYTVSREAAAKRARNTAADPPALARLKVEIRAALKAPE
jgi:hypothetical protein